MQPAPRAVPVPGDADDGAAQAWACADRDRDAISLNTNCLGRDASWIRATLPVAYHVLNLYAIDD